MSKSWRPIYTATGERFVIKGARIKQRNHVYRAKIFIIIQNMSHSTCYLFKCLMFTYILLIMVSPHIAARIDNMHILSYLPNYQMHQELYFYCLP